MKIYKYSANSFESMKDLPFSSVEYSKFKHGSKRVSRLFGVELGKKFTNDLNVKTSILPNLNKIVVCSAPYKFIPVASTILTDYFISIFNKSWAIKNDSIINLKVFRGHSYNDDYGSMTIEEREKAISSDDFYIDTEIIKDKDIIFVDDIRITGAHEKRIESLLTKAGFTGNVVFLYYADYAGDGNPNIENELNYGFVNDLLDIDYIIKNDEFVFNTRVTKYILKSNPGEFESFIRYQTKTFRNTLLTNLLGNDYHKQDAFKTNYEILTKYV